MKQLDYIILWWFRNLKSHGIDAFLTRRGVCWRLTILTWRVSNFPWFSNQDNSMFFHGWSFPMYIYPSFRPFIRSNIVLFFIYFFFNLFDTVLTYFLLKNFKRWAHHWISLPVYINNQKPRWNFFFLNRLRKRNETFGRLWSQCKNFTAKKHSHRRKGVEGWGGRSPGRKINQCSRF